MATSLKVAASSDGSDVDASGRRALYPKQRVRLITEDDIPFMLELGDRRYPGRYDRLGTEMWFRNIVLKGPMMFLPIRSDNAFMIAMLSTTPWTPHTPEANVTLVCADDGKMWQAVMLLRASIEWARRRKCSLWRISSETDFDLGPIAHKLGATEPNTRWQLRFDV
jgi:hypothetical protein